MATVRLSHKTFNNFSGGYACEQAYVTEDRVSFIGGSQNVDIYATDNEGGYGFKKIAGNTLYAKFTGEKIQGLYSYNYEKDHDYLLVHTTNDTEGKLWYINEAGEKLLLKDGLNKDATESGFVNFSQTLPTKRYLGIFGNGVDPLIKIEVGANPEVEEIDEQDSEGRDIRSNILETYYGRVWCGVDDRVHWSKSLDPFTWATETDDAGWAQLDSDIVGITTFAGGLIVSTKKSIYYADKDSSGGFIFASLSPNHALSSKGLVKHDNYGIYVADDGIYPVNVTQEDTKRVDENIAWIIQNYFNTRDKSRNSDIFTISVTSGGRNEVWFHIPIIGEESKSFIFIYRFITGRQKCLYFLPPRIQPKINCLLAFNDLILSGNDDGEILQELTGETFNGQDIVSIAEFPEIDFNGTYNKQKFKLYLYSEINKNNRFYVDYFYNGESEYERQEVILENQSFCWDEGNWDEMNWTPDVLLEYMLDKPRKHNRLKLRFAAYDSTQSFTINRVVTSRVKVKDK